MKKKPDFTYLSCGAGVQSGTIVEMIVEGELPMPDLIMFADTGDEPQYVYDHVKYLKTRRKRADEIRNDFITYCFLLGADGRIRTPDNLTTIPANQVKAVSSYALNKQHSVLTKSQG